MPYALPFSKFKGAVPYIGCKAAYCHSPDLSIYIIMFGTGLDFDLSVSV